MKEAGGYTHSSRGKSTAPGQLSIVAHNDDSTTLMTNTFYYG